MSYNQAENASLPIGIFDSGVGGLTVLAALLRHLPSEDYYFLGDTARLPYGTKGPETIINYTVRAAARIVKSTPIKMLVVACNTASSVCLPTLRAQYPHIPVLGVIEPGAKAAVSASRSGCIAVLATEATVRGGAYTEAIHRLNPGAKVLSRACTLFVSLAEEGWLEGDIVEGTARRYLSDILKAPERPDTILLGCTHFPLLQKAIANVAGDGVRIVDSAETTARAVSELLAGQHLANPSSKPGKVHFMATDNVARFAAIGGNFLGRSLEGSDVELVDL